MKTPPHIDKNICEYIIDNNEIRAPLLIDLPHGGRIYPDDFRYDCPKSALQKCEELYLDELFAPPTLSLGGAVVKANFPRTYVDVNRSITDIDNLLFNTPWPDSIDEKGRSVHGHGVIMRLIRADEPLYSAPLTHEDVRKRLNSYYSNYHNMLGYFSNVIHEKFGVIYHLNCHSMPSSVLAQNFPHIQPDFILGDLDGRSCGIEFRQSLSNTLKEMGYRVVINQLYKGAEIVNRYGQPAWGRHSLQIEINRALFQDEVTGQKNKGFDRLKSDLNHLMIQANRACIQT